MPGVPPDAVENVKRLLKGMFRRGKKNKQETSAEAPPNTDTTASQTPATKADAPHPEQPASITTAAHQTPAESATAAPDTNKQLPTQPVGTAASTESASANATTKLVAPTAGAPPESTHLDSRGVSPATSTPANSAPVSVIDTPPAAPPKIETASTAPHVADATNGQPKTSLAQPGLTEVVAEKETVPPPTPAKTAERVVPEAVASTGSEEPAPTPALDTTPVNAEQKPLSADPPAVQPAAQRAEPGMSATSGPLEDFPEGTK